MKKILAFLMAVTTCFCTFTACGDNNSDDDKSDKSVSSEKDDDKDDKDDEDDKSKDDEDDEDDKSKDDEDDKSKDDEDDKSKDDEDDKSKDDEDDEDDEDDKSKDDEDDEDDNNSGSGSDSDDVYLELFTEFCENAMDKDTDGLMNLTFPQVLIDALIEINAYDFMLEEIDGSYSSMTDVDLSKIELSSVTDCDAATVEKLEKLYSVYSNLFIVMAENDISYEDIESGNIDDEKAMLILEPAMQLSQLDDIENMDVEIIIPFEEAKFVTLTADGEDQKFVMYRVDGDDWKIDTIGLAMFGF